MYCKTGISRSSTVALTYISIFKRFKTWGNLVKSEEQFKIFHPVSFPNIRVIQKCIKDNQDFQSKIQDEQMKIEEERLKAEMLIKEEEELRKLALLREQRERDEAQRIMKIEIKLRKEQEEEVRRLAE